MTDPTAQDFRDLLIGENGDGFNVCQHIQGDEHRRLCDACFQREGEQHLDHCHNMALNAALAHAATLHATLEETRAELARRDAARKKIHDSFNARLDDKCQCPYCRGDAEALAEMAANNELDWFSAEQKLIAEKAELSAEVATLREREKVWSADYVKACQTIDQLQAELTALRTHYVAVWSDRANAAFRERDEARATIAQAMNDPAPTGWAYKQACAALEKHRTRADEAERQIAAVLHQCDVLRRFMYDRMEIHGLDLTAANSALSQLDAIVLPLPAPGRTGETPTAIEYGASGQGSNCPECGPNVSVDEDGCCASCGADAVVYRDSPSLQVRVDWARNLFEAKCRKCGGSVEGVTPNDLSDKWEAHQCAVPATGRARGEERTK